MREFCCKPLKLRNFVVFLILFGIVGIIPMWSSVSHAGITQLTNDAYKDMTPAWSPDGTKIAFASKRGGDYDIWVINPDGTGLTNLTNTTGADEKYPSWRPDGTTTTIAYTKNIGGYSFGKNYLCIMNSDGTQQTELDLKGTDDGQDVKYWGYETKLPVWSPDGSQIAFVSFGPDGGSYKIYTYTMDGGAITEVTPSMDEQNSFGDIYRIWWSGGVITYDRYPIGIQTFVPNSLNPQEVGHSQYQVIIPGSQTPQGEGNTPTEPTWSPDGTKLLFTRGAFYQPTDTFVIYVPSKGLMIPLDQVVTNATWGSWSPDGTKIAFVNDISGNSDIQVTTLPEFPSASHITGTYTVFEYERGFNGLAPDGSWGNTTSQWISKSVVTFSPDGTVTLTYDDTGQNRSITEDQNGNNIFTTTPETDSGTDVGTYFVSADGVVTLIFMEDGMPDSVTAYISNDGNTIVFGDKGCDYTEHECEVSMGIGVKQGSGFSVASLNGTYIVGEFGSGFSGGPDSLNWGATDNSFVYRHVIIFDGAGGFTVTNPEEGEIHRNIGNIQGQQTGDNIFTTTADSDRDDSGTGTYTVSPSGIVTLNFPDGSLNLYLSADGNSAIFSESEFNNDEKSCDLNIGIGIKQGSGMSTADLKGTYVLGEFATEFHGQITMSAGWGAWDSETMSINMVVFDGAGNYSLSWMDLGLKQEISEASEGGPFFNSYNVEEPWEDISGSETGTYTVSSEGKVTLNFIEDGQPESLVAYLSADKNTVVWGESYFDDGSKEASNDFGAGIKKSAGFQLLEKGNTNGINGVDLGDAIQALQVVSGLFPAGAYFGADLNGDGKIGIEEAIYVLQTVANLR